MFIRIFILFIFFISFVFEKPVKVIKPWKLYGLWKGVTHEGNYLSFLFERNHILTISTGATILGSSGKEPDEPRISYSVDLQKTPNEIDIILQREKKKEYIKGILMFFDDHRIMIYSSGKGKPRPEKFKLEDYKNVFLLTKTE